MNRQKEILIQIANKHHLSIQQAEEIWKLFGDKIFEVISDPNKKNEEGLYDINKFQNIQISNFGKFVPVEKNIRHANMCIKSKDEKKNS